MPPRIRSPSEESDQLSDSPVLAHAPLPALPRVTLTASSSRPLPPTPPTAGPSSAHPTSDDQDDLSSLSSADSDDGRPVYAESEPELEDQSEPEDDVEEEDAFSAGYEDDEIDEVDELDEYDPVPPPPKKLPAQTTQGMSTASLATGGPSNVKIKFKLGGGGAAKAVVTGLKSSKPAKAGSSNHKKGKGKRREDDPSDFSDEEEHFSDASADSSFSGGVRLTARQRAKEMGGEFGMELQSLSNLKGTGNKPVVKLTDAEVALRRSENSRKRKHQSDKRLEDEKTETINRLLKKQVGRQRSKLSTTTTNPNNQSKTGDDDGIVGDFPATTAALAPVLPTMVRYISSTHGDAYSATFAVPVGMGEMTRGPSVATGNYPGPRPPLKTRRLVC